MLGVYRVFCKIAITVDLSVVVRPGPIFTHPPLLPGHSSFGPRGVDKRIGFLAILETLK